MTDYTPAPWKVDQVNENQVLIRPNNGGYALPICRMSILHSVDTQAANARLIAAAPALLEAAQGAIAALSFPHVTGVDVEIARTWLAEAITKATGEATQ